MKFQDLFRVLHADAKIAIDGEFNMLKYTVAGLGEDILFYEEIKNKEVKEVWYSTIYNAIVIEIE